MCNFCNRTLYFAHAISAINIICFAYAIFKMFIVDFAYAIQGGASRKLHMQKQEFNLQFLHMLNCQAPRYFLHI